MTWRQARITAYDMLGEVKIHVSVDCWEGTASGAPTSVMTFETTMQSEGSDTDHLWLSKVLGEASSFNHHLQHLDG